MARIEETITRLGFAWLDDDTGQLIWAFKEDFEGQGPEERPKDATPVMIEITPTVEWVEKKRKEHEFLGDLQEQMSKFTTDLRQLEKNLKVNTNE